MPRTMSQVSTIYIRKIKIINILFAFYIVKKTTDKVALLNSKAIENFLEKKVWKRLQIGWF